MQEPSPVELSLLNQQTRSLSPTQLSKHPSFVVYAHVLWMPNAQSYQRAYEARLKKTIVPALGITWVVGMAKHSIQILLESIWFVDSSAIHALQRQVRLLWMVRILINGHQGVFTPSSPFSQRRLPLPLEGTHWVRLWRQQEDVQLGQDWEIHRQMLIRMLCIWHPSLNQLVWRTLWHTMVWEFDLLELRFVWCDWSLTDCYASFLWLFQATLNTSRSMASTTTLRQSSNGLPRHYK